MVLCRMLCLLVLAAAAYAAPSRRSGPTVKLDEGIFEGARDLLTDTNQFLGIPFAQPPVGNLRFNVPVANSPYTGNHDATSFGPSCIGQGSNPALPGNLTEAITELLGSIVEAVNPDSEDCLTLNVFQPANMPKNAKLPVVAWIYGGGFEGGSANIYPGGLVVSDSVDLNKPVIYVSMNYRVSAYGFLAGQEVKDAGVGNLGLLDQRMALRWIQKYISTFGGDPTKVTIWGESAGAISVALHLVANNGDNEGLFRAAAMESGSPIPVGDITHGQKFYDALVEDTGCSTSADTLACLRTVPLDKLKTAVNNSPGIFSFQSLNLAWLPRADGAFITDDPQKLVQAGKVANVPFITGDVDDEGTLFTLSLLNITTDQEVHDYILSNYVPGASQIDMDTLMTLYPQDITQGSPFDTGDLNALTPQFKRLAAIQGDLVFQGPRRFFLQQVSGRQPTWSFLSKRFKFLPVVGSVHASDLLSAYAKADFTEYIVNFVNNLNPNDGDLLHWPQYSTASPQLLTMQDDILEPLTITQDTYREEGMAHLIQLALQFPL